MLKLLEVLSNPDSEGNREELASMDVTALTEQEQNEALGNARALYGDVFYQYHSCGHDEGLPCSNEEVS